MPPLIKIVLISFVYANYTLFMHFFQNAHNMLLFLYCCIQELEGVVKQITFNLSV